MRRHLQARVDHPQAFSGAAGQGNLAGFDAQIACGPLADLGLALPHCLAVPVHPLRRVAVEFGAVAVDALLHWPRVGGHQEVDR